MGYLGDYYMFIFAIICSWFIDRNKEYTEDSPFYRFILYTCTKIVRIVARIRITVRGLEHVPKNSRYLLVGNHRSNFDPILSWEVLGKEADLCFLSKPENFRKRGKVISLWFALIGILMILLLP